MHAACVSSPDLVLYHDFDSPAAPSEGSCGEQPGALLPNLGLAGADYDFVRGVLPKAPPFDASLALLVSSRGCRPFAEKTGFLLKILGFSRWGRNRAH